MFSPHLSRSFILYACMLSPRLSGSLNLYFRLRGLAFSAPHMYLAFANDFHIYPTVLSNCCARIYKPVLRNKLASIKKKKKKKVEATQEADAQTRLLKFNLQNKGHPCIHSHI